MFLQEEFPDIFRELHPFKNEGVDIYALKSGSGRKIWWKCSKGHEWKASIYDRAKKSRGCPYCSGQKIIVGETDLRTTNPDLAAEWHPTKNGELLPTAVKASSGKKVWWLGRCGHEWEAQILSRTHGTGCPYCSNQKVLKGFNDLATVLPNLAQEWHPIKNGELKPWCFVSKSGKKVWWLCKKCGYEWEATINSRAKGAGCPVCGIEKQKRTIQTPRNGSSFADKSPLLVKEWHPLKNGQLKPEDINSGSHRKVWWLCSNCGHEWCAEINSRTRGSGCPECGKQRTAAARSKPTDGQSLKDLFPDIAIEWDYEKNLNILPEEVAPKSEKKIWWKCLKGHSWCATVGSRTAGSGCPVCAQEAQTSFPEQALVYFLSQHTDVHNRFKVEEDEVDLYLPKLEVGIEYDGCYWHREKKEKDAFKEKRLLKKMRIYRVVEELGAEFRIEENRFVYNPRNNYADLPLVIESLLETLGLSSNAAVILNQENRIAIYNQYMTKEKEQSLAVLYPELAEEFHPTKNGELKPSFIKPGSQRKFWWKCSNGHEWETSPYSRVKGSACPYCSGRLPIPGETDLPTTHPLLIQEWHPVKNQGLEPSLLKAGSNKKVWWKCSNGHEWEAKIYNRTYGKQGCPYCSGQRIIAGETDLATVCPDLAAEWHPTRNGDLNPCDVKPQSGQKVWWICRECGYVWSARISARYAGNGCPECWSRRRRCTPKWTKQDGTGIEDDPFSA